ncbi:hypothetical protein T484DRAFT_1802470 [Baffinella frigidus]|nr:hypothetical protein T484DRAFT_1802470 [Cryptophyta sp. CCMP2293]
MRGARTAVLLVLAAMVPGVLSCASTALASKQHRISPALDFGMGAVSGCTASLMVFPIDLAKTRIQDQRIIRGVAPIYTSIIQTIKKVASEEGHTKL